MDSNSGQQPGTGRAESDVAALALHLGSVSTDAPQEPVLECAGVSVRRGATDLVTGLDLRLRGGEVLVLTGRSGIGKTSLLHTIAGLTAPSAGTVRRTGRATISFQEPRLLPWLSVRRNVALAGPGVFAPRVPRRADELLSALGIDGVGGRRPRELSGGMARRVSLARALYPAPKLLAVDEPFSQLDDASVELVAAALAREAAAGAAIVITAHSIGGGFSAMGPYRRLEAGSGKPALTSE